MWVEHTMSEIDDYTWCQKQLLWEIGFMGGCIGAYESYLFNQMVEKNGQDRPTWQGMSPGRRAIVVAHAIDRLIGDARIVAVRTEGQQPGSRCFRIENILLTIVAALEDDDADDD